MAKSAVGTVVDDPTQSRRSNTSIRAPDKPSYTESRPTGTTGLLISTSTYVLALQGRTVFRNEEPSDPSTFRKILMATFIKPMWTTWTSLWIVRIVQQMASWTSTSTSDGQMASQLALLHKTALASLLGLGPSSRDSSAAALKAHPSKPPRFRLGDSALPISSISGPRSALGLSGYIYI